MKDRALLGVRVEGSVCRFAGMVLKHAEQIRETIKAEQGSKCRICLKPRFGMELRKPGMPCVCGLEGSGEPPEALGGTRSRNRAICRMLAWGAGGGEGKFLVLMLTRS